MRALEDGDSSGQSRRGDWSGRRHGRRSERGPVVGAGGEADPRRGHRQLGRHGRGGAIRAQGRDARAGLGPAQGPGRVAVADRVYEASRAVVIGIGTRPSIPPIPGLGDLPYWTNREVLEAEVVPRSLAVLGGGAIGVELAQALSRFGAKVTILEAAPRLVAAEEPEASAVLEDVLRREGLGVITSAGVEAVRGSSGQFHIDA